MDYSYSYQHLKRDLTDVLNNMIVNIPRFISLFAERAQAINTRHEWNENVIDGYTEKVTSNVDGVLTLTTDGAKEHFPVGALLKKQGDSAVFRVTAVDSATNKITVTLAAAHGSSLTAATIAANDILAIIAVPKNEGTRSGDDGTIYTGTNHNFTQIVRRDVVLSGTSLAVKRYGMENAMTRQLEYKMLEITRELNKTAIDGIRAERTASVKGSAGGVYEFGNVLSHLVNNVPLTDKIVNDAAEKILNAGGSPDTIVCHSSQCRVLSNIMRDKILVQRGDQARGPYVMEVYSDITGQPMRIFAEPEFSYTDIIVCDSAGFGLSWLEGRQLHDWDSTPKDFDGSQRSILGEFTFEFINGGQRICPVRGLAKATDALDALETPKPVTIASSAESPIFTKAVTE